MPWVAALSPKDQSIVIKDSKSLQVYALNQLNFLLLLEQ